MLQEPTFVPKQQIHVQSIPNSTFEAYILSAPQQCGQFVSQAVDEDTFTPVLVQCTDQHP